MDDEITVYVVDDDAAVRDSLRWMIEGAGLRVETFASAEDFLTAYDSGRGGCLVLDIRMPGMNGMALQKQLISRRIPIGIIFITAHGTVQNAVSAMRSGAVDFLTKPFSEEALLDRINQCIGEARRQKAHNAERANLAARFALLTPREQEILRDVISGKSNKVIAAERHISQKTVEAHRANMMQKLQARSLAELMRMVLPREDLRGKP
ncbi:MAG: response regulator transcription factor [Gammaproteobacteria bacterium]|nr:response regulator transcription factor [Gammaproteobacteria bacterium]